MSRYTSRGVFLLALILTAGLVFVYQYKQNGQLAAVNSTVGDRKLPIYCVDTEEKKVALSFDAAWAGGQRRTQTERCAPIHSPAYSFANAMPSPT